MADTDHSAPESAARHAFALAAIENMGLAIPADHMVQALPWPAELTPVPRRQSAIAGVFRHRGNIVPLVDLRTWFDGHTWSNVALSQVLILKSGDRIAGLAVSQVSALVQAHCTQVHRVHHDEETEEFFHSVLVSGLDAAPSNVLDVGALMNHVAVWGKQADTAQQTSSALDAADELASQTPLQCVVRLADTHLAFAATEVAAVLPMPAVQRLGIPGSRVFGLIVWRGRNVPLVDILGALNMPGDGGLANPLVLVIQVMGRYLAFPVSQEVAVQRFSQRDLQALEPVPEAPLSAVSCVMLDSGNRAQMFQAQDLLDYWTISSISEDGGASSPAVAETTGRESISEVASAVFEAGQQWATGLDQIEAILEFPEQYAPSQSPQRNVLGTFEWSGQQIALLDLRAELGHASVPPDSNTRVIVVRVRQQLAGLVVDNMQALIPANLGTLSDLSIGRGVTIQMVTTGSAAAQRSYRMM